MQITDPTIISFEEMELAKLMQSVEKMNGDFIVAYTLNADGNCADNVLVLETDIYGAADEELLDYDGMTYNWEVDLYSLISIKKYSGANPSNLSIDELVDEAKYYLVNRAPRPVSK